MTVNIQYPKQFSKEFKDFIIILSKISELNNIKNLPFDINSLSGSKGLEKSINSTNYYENFVKSTNGNFYHNIKIFIIKDSKKDQIIIDGAKFFTKLNKKSNPELNFIFPTRSANIFNLQTGPPLCT